MSQETPEGSTENISKVDTIEDLIDGSCYLKSKHQEESICVACNYPIKGVIVQALGKTWHQNHFCCVYCKKPISGEKFNVEGDKPYCEHDYSQLFLKRCQRCNLPIRDVVVMALNHSWHYNHFVCFACGNSLVQQGYFEKENNAFCKKCFEERFTPKCKECGNPIPETAIIALGDKWHQDCFKCTHCFKPITKATFEVFNGKQLCENCVSVIPKAEETSLGEAVPLISIDSQQ